MSDYDQFAGGGAALGDLRHLVAGSAAPVLNQLGRQWVRTGTFITYDAQHAPLLALFPGLGSKAMPAANSIPSGYNGTAMVFYVGSTYVYLNGSSQAYTNWNRSAYSSNLSSWTVASLAGLTNLRAGAQVGSVVLATGNDDTAGGIKSFSGTGWSNVSGGIASEYNALASSGSLAVAAVLGGSTNGANNLTTSANGTSWTNRTGAGGGSFTIAGLHWSPCASAFLHIGTGAINKSANGYTQTACTLPAGVAFTDDGYGLQAKCASSSSVTLLLMSDGRLLRTTDGSTFTIVDLPGMNLAASVQASDSGFLAWDGTRFVRCLQGGATASPAFLYSTDGLTWAASCAFDDFAQPASGAWVPRGLSLANGKLLLAASLGSSPPPTQLYDMSGLANGAADRVGTLRTLKRSQTSELDTIAYVRTK